MENMTMRVTAAAQSARALLCATPAADSRTYDVRADVRLAAVQTAAPAIWATRVRVTAPTNGMGLVGTKHIAFATGTVPGSLTWSPPI